MVKLINWAVKSSNITIADLPDYYMLVDPTDNNIAPPLLKDGIWEPKSTEVLKKLIKPGDVMIDCGAHWGYYTLLGAVNGASVFSFEPNPDSFKLLSLNVQFNHEYIASTSGSATPFPLAVWSNSCLLNFVPEKGTTGGSHVIAEVIVNPKEYTKGIIVNAVALDDIFIDEKIDFIKIDCEQSDSFALKGMRRILTEQSPKLMVENPNRRFLEELGYKETHAFKDEQTNFWIKS